VKLTPEEPVLIAVDGHHPRMHIHRNVQVIEKEGKHRNCVSDTPYTTLNATVGCSVHVCFENVLQTRNRETGVQLLSLHM
jgi:hypothetical protein